jgi:hypothetical protein
MLAILADKDLGYSCCGPSGSGVEEVTLWIHGIVSLGKDFQGIT